MTGVSKEKRDELVDDLLIQLNDEVDTSGNSIHVERFSFSEELSSDRTESLGVSFEELTVLLNLCLSRRYLKREPLGIR